MKLHYFALTGRAEVSRLLLTYGKAHGKVTFEDVMYPFGDPGAKAVCARNKVGGQLPVLDLDDGTSLSQSMVIERFLAKRVGLAVDGDDVAAAKGEAVQNFMEDIWQLIAATMKVEDKVGARKELQAGKLADKMKELSAIIEAGQNGYICEGKLSYVDLHVWNWLCLLSNGFLDGFEFNWLDAYPTLQKFRTKISSEPFIKEFYAVLPEGDPLKRFAYQPAATAAFTA